MDLITFQATANVPSCACIYVYIHTCDTCPYTVHTPVFSLETPVESLVWNPGRNSCFREKSLGETWRPATTSEKCLPEVGQRRWQCGAPGFFCEILGEIQRIAHVTVSSDWI